MKLDPEYTSQHPAREADLKIKPVRNETDYDEALKAVNRLMGAAPGTPEGDELEALTTLVEAYEAEHWPVEPPDTDDELMRLAQAGEVRLAQPNVKAVYTRPPKKHRLPHEEVMALLDWVRGDR